MATGNGFVGVKESDILKYLTQGTAPPGLTTPIRLGLFGAALWLPTHVYADGSFVAGTNSGNTRLFKSTSHSGTGTSQSSDPFSAGGSETTGQVVVDNSGANQINWTEQTNAMDVIADGTASFISELSGSGYALITTAAGWGAVAGPSSTATGSTISNSAVLAFAQATADWVRVLGWFLVDSNATKKYLAYGRFANQVAVLNGTTPQFNAAALALTAD